MHQTVQQRITLPHDDGIIALGIVLERKTCCVSEVSHH